MPRIGVSITKSVAFRNSTQEFSNVYYYELDQALPNETDGNAIISNIATQEKQLHSTLVSFVRGRLWSQGGSPATNNMISVINLSGTGAQGPISGFDKERAYLFRFWAGVDSRGNPVYLRKWYHSCGRLANAVTPSNAVLEQATGFNSTERAALAGAVGTIHLLSVAGHTGHLVSKGGRQTITGEGWDSHPFLEHRQLGEMWRAQ